MKFLKELYETMKDNVVNLFKSKAIIKASSGRFNGVFLVNGKRVFIPAHTKLRYGVGITEDKSTWPKV